MARGALRRRREPVFRGRANEARRLRDSLAKAGLVTDLRLTGRGRQRTLWLAADLANAARRHIAEICREPEGLISALEADDWFCPECGQSGCLGLSRCPACGSFIGDPHAM